MGLGIDPAWNSEAGQFQFGIVVLTGLRITSGAGNAPFHCPHSRIEVQLGGQRLRREEVLWQMWVETAGVKKDGVTADRHNDRDAPIEQQLSQITYLTDPRPNMVFLE
jgi:hypothetical protein